MTLTKLCGGRLSRRILVPFLLMALIISLVGMILTISITTHSLDARTENQLSNDAAVVEQSFQDVRDQTVLFASLLVGAGATTDVLPQPLQGRSVVISLLNSIRRSGMKVKLYRERPQASKDDISTVEKGFLGLETVGIARMSENGATRVWIQAVSPIETRSGVDRVVAVSFPLTSEYLTDISRRISSHVTVLLPGGETISSLSGSDKEVPLRGFDPRDAGRKVERPYIVSTKLPDGPAKTMVRPFKVEFKQDGFLLLTMPMSDLLAVKKTIFIRGFLITGLILLLTGLLYASLVHRVSRPLEQLSAATRDIAQGNLDLQVQVDSLDELGDLAASFNEMVRQIKESQHQVEQWGHSLEKRVEERTVELEQARSDLESTNMLLSRAFQEVKVAYANLERAQSSAVAAEKLAALGRLTAGVSHEILNPLNVISLRLHMLINDSGTPPEVVRHLKTLQEQSGRIAKITQDLLSYARQRPKQHLPIDLNGTVTSTLRLLEYDLTGDNIRLELALEEDLPLVLADPDQVQQVVLNLLANARDAMPGGGSLVVTTGTVQRNGKAFCELRVKDTGSGIAPQDMDKLFEPFFTTKPEGEGTGLGLAICQGIVEAHGGSIWAESAQGVGSALTVVLPMMLATKSSA